MLRNGFSVVKEDVGHSLCFRRKKRASFNYEALPVHDKCNGGDNNIK